MLHTADNPMKTQNTFKVLAWLLPAAAVLAPAVASAQSFGAETIGHRTYMVGHALIPLTLPAATPGSPSYTLPNLPAGLSFTATTRVLSGAPSTPTAVAAYTYTATSGVNSASLTFRLAVIPSNAAAPDGFIVSNLDDDQMRDDNPHQPTLLATAFVTGVNADGYTGTGAVIRWGPSRRNNLRSVSIYSGPSTLLGKLDGPTGSTQAIQAGGHFTYTSAAGIPLAPSTTYQLAIETVGSRELSFGIVRTDSQTSFDGWDISPDVLQISGNQFVARLPNFSLHFSISAFPADVTPSALAGLAASPFSGGVTLTWTTPTAIATTYQYRQRPSGSTYDNWIGAGPSPLVVSGLSGCTTFQVTFPLN